MNWTKWKRPGTTVKYNDDLVGYQTFNSYNLLSQQEISGVSAGYSNMTTTGVDALHFTDWGWETGRPIGIQVYVHVSRLARISDLVIQLTYDNELIGLNLADLDADDINTYGGHITEWLPNPIPDLDATNIGLVLDYQPHPSVPCSELVYIRDVKMRIAYNIACSGTVTAGQGGMVADQG